jgi:hypothetical protein
MLTRAKKWIQSGYTLLKFYTMDSTCFSMCLAALPRDLHMYITALVDMTSLWNLNRLNKYWHALVDQLFKRRHAALVKDLCNLAKYGRNPMFTCETLQGTIRVQPQVVYYIMRKADLICTPKFLACFTRTDPPSQWEGLQIDKICAYATKVNRLVSQLNDICQRLHTQNSCSEVFHGLDEGMRRGEELLKKVILAHINGAAKATKVEGVPVYICKHGIAL